MPTDLRQPLSPAEFDAVCRELLRQCPWLSETSGQRSLERNTRIGAHPESKHLIGMARDFGAESQEGLDQGAAAARELGLWTVVHDIGRGNHIHTQGLAPGPVPEWWRLKYMPRISAGEVESLTRRG